MDRVPTRKQVATQTPGPADKDAFMVGQRILDQYEIFEVNEGSFGYVLGVTNLVSRERIAVKIPKRGAGYTANVEEFTREVALWVDLAPHANIVTARFVKEVRGNPALFMDYVEGKTFRTLRDLIRTGKPTTEAAIDFAYQISLGMEAANEPREVVHMDLKPENVMIEKGNMARITDFGLAHRVRVVNGRYEMRYAGSWPYAAPERFANEPCDQRSDLYSLGVILYEMLTGAYPYPFELSEDQAESYEQLRAFHAQDGMDKIVTGIYYNGVPGNEGQVGEVVSTFLHPSRGERTRGFRQARVLLQQLGGKSQTAPAPNLSISGRLARAEGLQAVGEHSAALSILNRLLMEEPGNGALYLAAAKSLDATGETGAAKNFRERARSIIRSGI